MKKSICLGLTLMALTAALWCADSREAAAQTYHLENASGHQVNVALLLPTNKGWFVSQWYTLQPYSRKKITHAWALAGKFGFYAKSTYDSTEWKGNSMGIVSSKGSSHPYNRNPGGSNVRKVGFIIKNGNSIKLTVRGEVPRNRTSSGGGNRIPNPPGNW